MATTETSTATNFRQRSTGSLVLLLLFARVGAAVMSAAIGLVVPRALSKPDSANYGIVIGVALMFVVLTDLGLTTSTARALAEGRLDGALWRRVAFLRAGAALAGAALFFGFAFALHAGVLGLSARTMSPTLVMAGGALIIAASLSGVAAGLLPTLRRVNMLLVVTLVQPTLEFSGVVLAVLLHAGASAFVMASTTAAFVAGTIGVMAVARGIGRREVTADVASDMAMIRAYGWPMFLVAISFTLFGQVDQLVLFISRGADYTSTYIWSWKLVALLHVPGLAAATIVAPRFAISGLERLRANDEGGLAATAAAAARRNLFAGWLRLLLVLYLGIATLAASLAPWLIPVAFGPKYAADWPVFASLALYAALLGIAPLVTMAANFLGGAGSRVRLGFVTISLNLGLDLLLVPKLGWAGAAIGTSVAFSWYVIAHTVLSWRLLGGTIFAAGAYGDDHVEFGTGASLATGSNIDSSTRAVMRLRANLPLALVAVASAGLCGAGANFSARALDGALGDIAALLIPGLIFAALYGAILLGFSHLRSIDLVGVAVRADDETVDQGDPMPAQPRVRVLHIADFAAPYPGAFICQLRMLNDELVAGGARPSAFAFPEHARYRDYHATLEAAGCEIYFLPSPTSRLERDVSAAVRDVIERSGATVVHTHFGTYDLSVTHAVRKLRAMSGPSRAFAELALVWHYRTALEERLDERTLTRRLKDYLKFARAGRHVDACCAVTEALALEVDARGMGSRARAVVAGCDTDTFRADDVARQRVRDKLGITADQTLILHLGWHWHRKGGDLLVAATLDLEARGYTNLVVASVGAPADLVEHPVRLIQPTNDIHELHAAADIFVSASRSEGFGNGLVEAMACERVAVATLVDGQREVFDGLAGCIAATPGDATSLADALATLLDARDRWAADGAANRAHIVDRHSMRRWARDMANVYRELGVPLTDTAAGSTPAQPAPSPEAEVA